MCVDVCVCVGVWVCVCGWVCGCGRVCGCVWVCVWVRVWAHVWGCVSGVCVWVGVGEEGGAITISVMCHHLQEISTAQKRKESTSLVSDGLPICSSAGESSEQVLNYATELCFASSKDTLGGGTGEGLGRSWGGARVRLIRTQITAT